MTAMSDPYEVDLSRWIAAAEILTADLQRCTDELNRALDTTGRIDQFWARAMVRTLFAYVEGSTFEMHRSLQQANDRGVIRLSLSEQAILAELTFDLDQAGRPKSRPKFLQIDRNIRFVFALYARAAHSAYQLDVSGEGWQSFLSTIQVRNRITHPRDPNALDLTIQEIQAAVHTSMWYSGEVRALMRTVPGPPRAAEPE